MQRQAARILKHRDVVQIVNKIVWTKTAGECPKDRVVEQSHADLTGSDKRVTHSVNLWCDGITNRDCLTVFDGMRPANDTYRTLFKRWASLGDAHGDVKTADGNMIRMICIGWRRGRRV